MMNKKNKPGQKSKSHADPADACKRRARALRKLDRLFAYDAFADRFDCGSAVEDAGALPFEFKHA